MKNYTLEQVEEWVEDRQSIGWMVAHELLQDYRELLAAHLKLLEEQRGTNEPNQNGDHA